MTIKDLKREIVGWRFTKYKIINLVIGISALLVYEFFGRPFYRPYIYSHNIYDFHIADTLGNSLGTIATIFILVSLLSSEVSNGKFLIKVITFSVVLYEIAQPLLGKPIDIWDIVATLLAGALSFLIFHYLFVKSKKRSKKDATKL